MFDLFPAVRKIPNIRIAFNEKDDSEELEKEAANFIKKDGKRLGRDIELYNFTAKVASVPEALNFFISEVVLALPKDEGFYAEMRKLGQEHLKDDLLFHYLEIFS